jgi:hypothetical protein
MRCDGWALRRRMRAMDMIDFPIDSTVDQTRVSRTGARPTARHLERYGRGALMFCRCVTFQMFQSPPRPRARDPPFIAAPTTPTNRSQ